MQYPAQDLSLDPPLREGGFAHVRLAKQECSHKINNDVLHINLHPILRRLIADGGAHDTIAVAIRCNPRIRRKSDVVCAHVVFNLCAFLFHR